jgi:hypothetical protein
MSGQFGRFSRSTGRFIAEVLGVVAIGAGVPLLWIWIGSLIQGARGAQTVEAATAAAVMIGIILTYVLILVVAGWIQGRSERGEMPPPVRYPWTRSMRDAPYRPGAGKLTPIETVFVATAVIATVAMLIWFFAFAGSPLPN